MKSLATLPILAALLFLLFSATLASAQTPITYKCWCTLHGGSEREYTVPANLSPDVTFPIEIPEYGRVLCHIVTSDAQAGTPNQTAFPASLLFSVATIQQLEAGKDGSYTSVVLVEGRFAQAFNKRILVLDTPAYSLSVELLKN